MTLALMRTLVVVLGELDVDPLSMLTSFAGQLLPLIERAEAYNKSQNQTLAKSMASQLQQSQPQPQPSVNMGLAPPISNTSMIPSSSSSVLPEQRQPQSSMETTYSAMNAGTPANYGTNNNWMEHWDKWLDFQMDGSFPLDAPDYFFF